MMYDLVTSLKSRKRKVNEGDTTVYTLNEGIGERYVFCFFASSGNLNIGMMEVEHPESNIAVSEKLVPLTVKVALINRDCCVVCR